MKAINIKVLLADADADKFTSFLVNAILSRTRVQEEISHKDSVTSKTEIILDLSEEVEPDRLSNKLNHLSDCGVVTFTEKPIITIITDEEPKRYQYRLISQNNWIKVLK